MRPIAVIIRRPRQTDEIEAVARLYWSAFAEKLGRVMGPQAKAELYLTASINSDFALCAFDAQGQIVGFAGYQTERGGLLSGDMDGMTLAYGRFGAAWRRTAMALLQRHEIGPRFAVDGIAVADGFQGQGRRKSCTGRQ